MNTLNLLAGALSLRTAAFVDLRGRSDPFYRGFLVLIVVGLISGAFQAGVEVLSRARPASQAETTTQIMQGIDQNGMVPPELRSMVEGYVREGVGIGTDINALAPQAGEAFRPAALFLDWLGRTLGMPFGTGLAGWLLVGGLFVHLTSRWLGGRAGAAQMLGLTALAFSPYVFSPLATVLNNVGGGAGAVAGLVSWVIFAWAIAVFVKATSVAQGFGPARSLGAILLAASIGLFLLVTGVIAVSAAFAGIISILISLFAR